MGTLSPADLAHLLKRWLDAGIIDAQQAERIRADARASTPTRAVTSLVTEAMGYLGGVIILVGLGLVAGWFWDEMSTAARVALAGAVAVVLFGAGSAVPRTLGSAGIRLRSVLWVASSAALFACLSLLGADGFGWDGDQVLVLAGIGTAAVSAGMWIAHNRLPQHAAVLVSVLISAAGGTALATEDSLAPMAAVWAVGVVWALLSWFNILRPRRAGVALGAIATVVGSMTLESEAWGTVLALLTVVTLVAVAVVIRDLVLLAVASVGTLVVLPAVITRYFPGVLAAALALVIVGLLLVGAAVFTARRQAGGRGLVPTDGADRGA